MTKPRSANCASRVIRHRRLRQGWTWGIIPNSSRHGTDLTNTWGLFVFERHVAPPSDGREELPGLAADRRSKVVQDPDRRSSRRWATNGPSRSSIGMPTRRFCCTWPTADAARAARFGKFKGNWNGLFGDVIEEVDWSVGQVFARSRKTTSTRRSLVIFTRDNGPAHLRENHAGSAGPLQRDDVRRRRSVFLHRPLLEKFRPERPAVSRRRRSTCFPPRPTISPRR